MSLPVLLPQPRSVDEKEGTFTITEGTRIVTDRPELGDYLASVLRPATGYEFAVSAGAAAEGDIVLEINAEAASSTGNQAEAYRLVVDGRNAIIDAPADAGLFAGIQTLRQLLPAEIESRTPASARWEVSAVTIVDAPRFAYRGVMLDIARHFFGVDTIMQLIDNVAAYKINHLHLHLSDDQGWRIEIPGWPELTRSGAESQVGGGDGGFLTTSDYEQIVHYAASRFITVVPEIDMPGHTNAAMVAYPELAPEGAKIAPYTGIAVGFSSFSIEADVTYRFIDDVVGHIASLTPGPFFHLGGDESLATKDEDYCTFMSRASRIVTSHGKTPVGWLEIGTCADLAPGTVGQYWSYRVPQDGADDQAVSIVRQGGALILSPADAVYLDIMPESGFRLGLEWTGAPTPLSQVADWDPATLVPSVGEENILGIEAPLWTETVETAADIDALIFPRLLAVADMAWADAVSDSETRVRALLPRLDAAGVQYGPA
ncbi:beta-N-acetylhexosaminidase [Paramicrobacterium agarici]|uniref:beta-N-acetylhexosaminidase n=1 Tax=Paramicrobacterium agarici TaxID=630514 RepID=A0A2A9E1C9_9MICO|nr:beta-N-acetylhexosaminidase [Microbacterium agarici]PFG32012.1 hexosaminidase [Microbacterium agarici]